MAQYFMQQDREKLRKEILEECARMIEQRVNIQVDTNALPKIRELNDAIKNLGRT